MSKIIRLVELDFAEDDRTRDAALSELTQATRWMALLKSQIAELPEAAVSTANVLKAICQAKSREVEALTSKIEALDKAKQNRINGLINN